MKIFSLDVETNGLYGQAFAIGAIVTNDDGEIAKYVSRCPIIEKIDGWVAENVLPSIKNIFIDQDNYHNLLKHFFKFYMKHKTDADIIAHIAYPVETKLLRDMIEQNLESREEDGPYPLIDITGILKYIDEDSKSVDAYIKKNNLYVPFEGSPHHPLYDAMATEVAYRHLMKS